MDYYSITLKCKGKNGKLYCKHTLIESEDNKIIINNPHNMTNEYPLHMMYGHPNHMEYKHRQRVRYDNSLKNKNNEKFDNTQMKSTYDVFGNFIKK